MKLWLITQDAVDGYDTYDSAVVCAETEDQARRTHPDGQNGWQKDYGTWAKFPEQVAVQLIGEALEGSEAGVVVASFNAG